VWSRHIQTFELAVQVVASLEEAKAGQGDVQLVVQDGVQVVLPLKGLFDVQKELARLERQKEKLQKSFNGLQARLSNANFVEGAPEKVVQESRAQAEELGKEIALVEEKVQQVKAM
jgi:valyl-tRNA synthetase